MCYQYKFTIFTPCYNSQEFIHRVYNSLVAQTYKNFEWLVINDGSSDNTSQIIKEYIKEAPFAVQFFDLPENQMLTKNYNLAVKNAKGDFFIPLGHDDECVPETLEVFSKYWEKYGNDKYSGISCLCSDQHGNLVGDKFPVSPFHSDYFEVMYDQNIKGEKWGFIKTDVMKNFMLPENIDSYVPEGLIWKGIGTKYQTIYINEVLRIYHINQPGSSLSTVNKGRNRYPEGGAFYNLQMINDFNEYIKGHWLLKAKIYVNYLSLSFLARINIVKIFFKVYSFKKKILLVFLLPLGGLLYIKQLLKK